MTTPARVLIGVCLAASIFVAGYMAKRQPGPAASPSTSLKMALFYTCPMHPQYRSDHPGDCPICGMRLVLANSGDNSGNIDAAAPDVQGMVRLSAVKQQLIGVRTDEVKRHAASHLVRVPGRVALDEQRLYRITAAVDGWIRELGQNSAGVFLKKDQLLASYYTANLVAASQTFVFALQTNAQSQSGDATIGYQRGPTTLSLQVALDSLRSLGMSEFQIEEIRQSRVAPDRINVYSPIDGFVIARNISPQQRFDKGAEMYRIADIGHVWVMTDIFEKDRQFLKPGALATVHYRGRDLPARMSDALPQFDPQSRTLKTRFELDNPGYILRPDMFVDVELHVDIPPALTVPADAVIDSGREKTVFVERSEGVFEPRQVETGWRLADRVEITKGLQPGERIVVSGNFLIDSESRMKLAAVVSPAAAEKAAIEMDPICGMQVDPKDPHAIKVEYGGKTWYFCSEGCKRTFLANPDKYVPKMSRQDAGGNRGPA